MRRDMPDRRMFGIPARHASFDRLGPGAAGVRPFSALGTIFVVAVLSAMIAGCGSGSATETTEGGGTQPPPTRTRPTEPPVAQATQAGSERTFADFSTIYPGPDGNRLVEGKGLIRSAQVVDVEVGGRPRWLAGVQVGDAILWATVLEDGVIRAFAIRDGVAEFLAAEPESLPPGMPPSLAAADQGAFLLSPSDPEASSGSAPFFVSEDRLAYIREDGKLVIRTGGEVAEFDINALPDTRILTDDGSRLLVLSSATSRYAHGVLGDDLEAGGFTLVNLGEQPEVQVRFEIPGEAVIEGQAVIWADWNSDGQREVIVTLSDADSGAAIARYSESGELVAKGPPIGRGFRWRHQIALAPFGPEGELELAVVRTPHIGGVVEFYRMLDGALEIAAEFPGYTSHALGSPNLDMALAADLDGDGTVEVVLTTQARTELVGVQRNLEGAEVVWKTPIDGKLTTNLAAVTDSEGRIQLAAGRGDGVVRLWIP